MQLWYSEMIAKAIYKGNNSLLAFWNANVFGWVLDAAIPPQVHAAGGNADDDDWDAAQLEAFENGADEYSDSGSESNNNPADGSAEDGL